MNTELQSQLAEIAKGNFHQCTVDDIRLLETPRTARNPIDVLQELSNQYGFAVAMAFKCLLQYQLNLTAPIERQGEILLNVAYYTRTAQQQILNNSSTMKATVFVSHILNDLVAELGISKAVCENTYKIAEHAIKAVLYAYYARYKDEDRMEQYKNSLNLLFANIEKLLNKPI